VIVGAVGCEIAVSSGSSSIVTLCCGGGSCCYCWSCQVTRGAGVRSIGVVSGSCATNNLRCQVVDVEPGVEEHCVSSSASSQIHHDLYAGST
jgi:hypothetical protein